MVASLAITTASPLSGGTVGTGYSVVLTASGGVPAYQWSLESGSLPDGLILTAGGAVTGTPTTAGDYSFTARVTDSATNTASKALAVSIASPPLVVTTDSPLPTALEGVPYSQTFHVSGGTPPYTWSSTGSLPPGLSFRNGLLSGTPAALGNYYFTVRVSDAAAKSGSKQFSVYVGAVLQLVTPTLDSGALGVPYSFHLLAEGGATPYKWAIASGSLPPGLAFDVNNGSIAGTPATVGDYTFSVRLTDQNGNSVSRSYTLVVSSGLVITTAPELSGATVGTPYSHPLSAVGGATPYTWTVTAGTLPAGVTLAGASGELSGTPAASGTFPFTVQVTDATGRKQAKQFTMTVAPSLTITTPPELSGSVGTAFSQLLTGTGGRAPYTWSVTAGSLPPGLILDGVTGELRGTPTAPGTFSFTILMSDSASAAATKQFTVVVIEVLSISTAPVLPGGSTGTAYSQALAATGGKPPYRWAVVAGALPPGMNLSADTGGITGTPTAPGDYEFTVELSDAAQVRVRGTLSIHVAMPDTPAVEISGLPDAAASLDQPSVKLAIAAPYPYAITGELSLSFEPDAAAPADDPAIQLMTGGRKATFTIPANQTEAVFASGAMALQTGTVAGKIRMSARLQSLGADITPADAPVRTVTIAKAIPVIRGVNLTRTAGGIEVRITAFSNTRELTRVTYRFTPVSGSSLQTTEVPVQLTDVAKSWYQDQASGQFGSQFVLVQPFSVQGSADAVGSVTVILTNSIGDSQPGSQ